MFNFLKKKSPEVISRANPGFEETERRTPKAGVILLIVMFIAGIFFGWRALDDLGRVPKQPEPLSSCGYSYQSGYLSGVLVRPPEAPVLYQETVKPYPDFYYRDSYGADSKNCAWNDIERNYKIPELFVVRDPVAKKSIDLSRQLSDVENSLIKIRDRAFPSGQILPDLQTQEDALLKQRDQLRSQLSSVGEELKAIDDQIRDAYKPVFLEHNTRLRWYDFWVFLLQLLFALPFFWIVLRLYIRLHKKNSPYTIIFTAMLGVASILLLRVVLFWFWDLFLAEILRTIWRWIQNFSLLRSLVFYGGMILSFAVFGGGVYYLQKRIFDPRRVAIRRFRSKQCPQCQANLDLAGFYCPNCGYHLREKCAVCAAPRFVDMPHCPNCGNKKQ